MMNPLPAELYRPAQVAAMDRVAIGEFGLPGGLLMQRAATAAYRRLRERWPTHDRLLVLCGSGNNGGDGWLIADLALSDGLHVDVVHPGDPTRLSGDAGAAARRYLAHGGRCVEPGHELPSEPLVVVDALLGTGLDRPVEGELAALIDAVNVAAARHAWPVLAIDIPSGLQGDTGAVMGTVLRASMTVCFIALKRGLLTAAGPAVCGEIRYESLGVPTAVIERETPAARRVDAQWLQSRWQPRPRDAHKGDHGHVLIVGGEYGMGGAGMLAAEAALRVGAGLVSLATRHEHVAAALARRPEIMAHGVASATDLDPLLARATVVAIGPGLGQGAWGQALFERVLGSGLPMVIDADALNLLAARPRPLTAALLSPHPGEAGRLLGLSTAEVQADRWAAAEALAARYQATVILKGPGSVIADGQRLSVCHAGNPGLASGGSGDVLTGVLGGLLAQRVTLPVAAVMGACVHAVAADAVAAAAGERGMVASDLMPWLRHAVNPPAGMSMPETDCVNVPGAVAADAETDAAADPSAEPVWQLGDESVTAALGAALARALDEDGACVYLAGEIGAGKSTLARGLLRALGHDGPVPSPTYTLIEPYDIAGRRCLHVDLYRLADPSELEYLGLRDEFDPALLLLIEWPERGAGWLPPADLVLSLADAADGGRLVRLQPFSARGRRLLGRLQASCQSGPIATRSAFSSGETV